MLQKGHPQNDRDGVYRGIRDAEGPRVGDARLSRRFKRPKLGELAAKFDIVLGVTPRQS